MPRKISKRKAIQAAKRQAAADAESRKNRKWPGTRRGKTPTQLSLPKRHGRCRKPRGMR